MGLGDGAILDELAHGDAEGLAATDGGVGLHFRERSRRELDRGIGFHLPVRDEKGASTGVRESTSQAGERLCVLTGTTCGVAGRQDDPVGVEPEGGYLGCCEKAIVAFQRLGIASAFGGGCQDEPGLRRSPYLAYEG